MPTDDTIKTFRVSVLFMNFKEIMSWPKRLLRIYRSNVYDILQIYNYTRQEVEKCSTNYLNMTFIEDV